jgi:hypothetical protein
VGVRTHLSARSYLGSPFPSRRADLPVDRAEETVERCRLRLYGALIGRVRRPALRDLLGELHEAGEGDEQGPRARRRLRGIGPCFAGDAEHVAEELEDLGAHGSRLGRGYQHRAAARAVSASM